MGKTRTLGNLVTTEVVSANTTAVSGRDYVLTASLTLTLPASPTAGDSAGV